MGFCISCGGKIRKAKNMEVLICSACNELLGTGDGASKKECKVLMAHEKVFITITIIQLFLPLLLAPFFIAWLEGIISEFSTVQVAFVLVFLLPVVAKLVQKLIARASLARYFKEKSSWKPIKKALIVKILIYTVLITAILVAAAYVLMYIFGGLVFAVTW